MKNVWTINSNGWVSCLFSGTYAQCRKYITGRWGHWPPYAFISQIESSEKFKRKYT